MVAHGGRGSHEVIVPRVAIWANHGLPPAIPPTSPHDERDSEPSLSGPPKPAI